ncbi:MAG: phage holin family protein [Neisseria sp.]|nr:phage holin family protein [Neisseria sp.]
MFWQESFARYQNVLKQGAELFLLRGQILQLDITQQISRLVALLLAILLGTVLLLVALLAALFGLNEVLPLEWKVPVFFGTAAILLLFAVIVVYRALKSWQSQSRVVQNTLGEIRQDLAYLRGEMAANSLSADGKTQGEGDESATRT